MGLIKTSSPAKAPDTRPDLRDMADAACDLPGWRQGLLADDAAVRRASARALVTCPDAVPALCARLADERDTSVQAAMLTSLAQLGTPAVAEGLLPLLRSEDAGLRNGAIEVLSGLPDAIAPSVEQLLNDEDGDVRIFAVNLLVELRHPRVPEWLAQVLAHEPAVNVVAAALEVAAEVATPTMAPALEAVRQRFAHEPYIVFATELALERIAAS